jgi:hypothetical protein
MSWIKKGWSALILAGVIAGCSDEGSDPIIEPPVPGIVVISLSTTNVDDGAALISVTGPGLSAVQSASGSTEIEWRLASPNEIRAIVMGDLVTGPILTAQAADLRRLSEYRGTVEEVADRDGVLRAGLAGYAVTVVSQSAPGSGG